MGIIIRIDVDRPYGRAPILRHCLSRLSSDLYFPRFEAFGYLDELRTMLEWLNGAGARSYVFFRQCTLPSSSILKLLEAGRHEIGLHLENSRTRETFLTEKNALERHIGRPVRSMSKHGSGGAKYGFHHHAPYEPDRYIDWAQQASMRVFLGNLENPTMQPAGHANGLMTFPSAFWLEPHWRDTSIFTVDWLMENSGQRDIVLLVHPENVLAEPGLVADFKRLIGSLESRVFE
jgi:hypothetical protein